MNPVRNHEQNMNNKNIAQSRNVNIISNGVKKTLLITGALLFFGFVPHVFAQGFVPLASIPGLTDIQPTVGGLATFFNNLYKFAIGFAAILAVIMIIWGGIEIATNKDNVSKIIDSKGRILQAVLGLVLVLSPVLVFSIINPSILNLSINLPELDTKSGVPVGAGSGATTRIPSGTDSTSGCSVSGISGILQVAVCPSQAAATGWGQTCTLDNLSGITNITTTDPANGVATTKSIVTCTGRLRYIFIDPGGTFTSISTAINRLRPLTSTADRSNNGSNAVTFANTCSGAGISWKTCISDAPLVTFAVPCQLTGSSAQTTWKCYSEALSCINLNTVTTRGLCSDNPGWTPFP